MPPSPSPFSLQPPRTPPPLSSPSPEQYMKNLRKNFCQTELTLSTEIRVSKETRPRGRVCVSTEIGWSGLDRAADQSLLKTYDMVCPLSALTNTIKPSTFLSSHTSCPKTASSRVSVTDMSLQMPIFHRD